MPYSKKAIAPIPAPRATERKPVKAAASPLKGTGPVLLPPAGPAGGAAGDAGTPVPAGYLHCGPGHCWVMVVAPVVEYRGLDPLAGGPGPGPAGGRAGELGDEPAGGPAGGAAGEPGEEDFGAVEGADDPPAAGGEVPGALLEGPLLGGPLPGGVAAGVLVHGTVTITSDVTVMPLVTVVRLPTEDDGQSSYSTVEYVGDGDAEGAVTDPLACAETPITAVAAKAKPTAFMATRAKSI
ncbi:MAG: hypothetical protein Q9157_007273 [Trypethelium eluteriae]